jgi:2-oxoglutarate decarboxylase
MERFLQVAAEGNVRVTKPTTPAQYLHILRRQAKLAKRRPLIVMTPTSLLRHPQATSRLEDLSDGRFVSVLGEPGADTAQARRLLLRTGKLYYDLAGHADRAIAVGRVEQLYPFPEAEIRRLIDTYPNLEEVVWVQEEPRNMGARAYVSPRLLQILPAHLRFGSIGPPERAS